MNQVFSFVIAMVFAASSLAAESHSGTDTLPAETTAFERISGAENSNLNDFVWHSRPVVVFANSPEDPLFIKQMELLQADADALEDRDVVILTDTDPDAKSDLRTKLRPRGFMLVLIGKDGGIKLRKPFPWDVRELSRTIDKMPIRQQEIDARR